MHNTKNNNYLLTSEFVSHGHPDKIADQISDCILDLYLTYDSNARVAVETLVTKDNVIIAGEVSASTPIHQDLIIGKVRNLLKTIGCDKKGFHWQDVTITNLIHKQSPDIAMGVSKASEKDTGAGDQGIMYGFAIAEAPCLIPSPIYYARELLLELKNAVESGAIPKLGPDAKTQVTLNYINDKPVSVQSVVFSAQHPDDLPIQTVRDILTNIIYSVLPPTWIDSETKLFINPTGRFVIGGPVGDCGVTGRKIMVDTYGGHVPHGGGAFSGKDATKVDRSASYMARYLAKNVVAAGLARKCLIQLSYAIGVSVPVSINIDTFRTNSVDESRIVNFIINNVDLSPYGIRKTLNLSTPMYLRTATYGHFGHTGSTSAFTWEQLDLVETLQSACINNYLK